ncbi:hypothetical protein FOV73_00830 [Escherichia coli]|nr:hypothetical protein FOV73_00830 [Escherichia coli]
MRRVLSGLRFVQCVMTMPDISPFNNLIIFHPINNLPLSRPLYLIPHLVSLPDLRAQNRPYHYSRESKPC